MGKATQPSLKLVVDHSAREPRIAGVYLVTDHGESLLERVEDALCGGVTVVQYRDKVRDYPAKLALGRELKGLCEKHGALFIVNDDIDLAVQLDADGVHLGQNDGEPLQARRRLGERKIIGVSTHTVEEALAAEAAGADYIGFGCIYPTASKKVPVAVGPQALAPLNGKLRIPVVAIGGIDRDNAAALIDAGADAVAVISAVLSASDPALAAAELALLFNRKLPQPRGKVLSIAGSDSGGGAGTQADLKTVTLLGSYAASVITAVTAQNTTGVTGIHPVPAPFVAQQLEAVLSDLKIDVVKIGMLYSAETALSVAYKLKAHGAKFVVLDPVMTAKGGADLLAEKGLEVLKKRLVPLTYLITPNVPEAEALTGLEIHDEAGMEQAALELHRMGARHVLIKGGHLSEGTVTDILSDGTTFLRFRAPRTLTRHTHGTGCTLASAIAAYLAQGEPLPVAVYKAKVFITRAIKFAQPLGKGHGPVNHYLAAKEEEL